jgi:MarR family transcriptional regulator for hemolysin
MPQQLTPPEAGLTPHHRRVAPLLRRTWYSLNQTFRRRIAHAGLTPDQFTALRWLSEGHVNGSTANELCELMTSDPNTMASLISRMEQTGLVTRRRHERDGRAQRIILTPEGRDTFGTVQQIALDLQKEILAVLSEEERDKFLDQLETLSSKCRTLLEDGFSSDR